MQNSRLKVFASLFVAVGTCAWGCSSDDANDGGAMQAAGSGGSESAGSAGSAGKGAAGTPGGSSSGGSSSGGSSSGGSSSGGSSSGGTGGANDCPDEEISCNDTCIDPQTDDQNCGECGKACLIQYSQAKDSKFTGGCEMGGCTPTWSPCFKRYANCEDVCTALTGGDAVCDNHACVSGAEAPVAGLLWDDEQGCEDISPELARFGSWTESCQTDFELEEDQYVRCCCTQ
jgi:hypothetical protein